MNDTYLQNYNQMEFIWNIKIFSAIFLRRVLHLSKDAKLQPGNYMIILKLIAP
jgi:hypothetical protein